ncbi:hypothetical protein [Lederbergia citrea]|nr:hypothetical protein [Lederbergia citrea]
MDIELENQVEAMSKVEVMDKYLDSLEKKIDASEIYRVVNQVFGIDLDSVSILSPEKTKSSRVVIGSCLNHYGNKITGKEIRKIINQTFGINLDGISSLEKAKISLFSKGQWIIRNEKDLFVVHTGSGDIDVKVFPTKYFTEQTGLEELPKDLQQSLTRIGYHYEEKIGSFYFKNPSGQAVPDAFKGQTIGAIVEVIHNLYSHL